MFPIGRSKQQEMSGLVVHKAVYGDRKFLLNRLRSETQKMKWHLASQIIDATVPLNFLVNDSGQLKLHEGVRKSGIMGFFDPVAEILNSCLWSILIQVTVDDLDELLIPLEKHKI